ncbi:MAG: hypothetical protein HYV26_11130 [Candidatus Hydrogenedentes bacterium]|nr:hypothetical protein [Candidatus Hydrogenedentota bacterium]
MNRFVYSLYLIALAACAAFPPTAAACATCFGRPDDAQTQGMNAAIGALLGVTLGVLMIAGIFLSVLILRLRASEGARL